MLFQQFAVFLNLYFLVMALSQFIPSIRIGLLYTYWAPLAFVITVTMLREAYDDFKRYLRDKELNSQLYKILTYDGIRMVPSSQLKVSDVIIIEKVSAYFFIFYWKKKLKKNVMNSFQNVHKACESRTILIFLFS